LLPSATRAVNIQRLCRSC